MLDLDRHGAQHARAHPRFMVAFKGRKPPINHDAGVVGDDPERHPLLMGEERAPLGQLLRAFGARPSIPGQEGRCCRWP